MDDMKNVSNTSCSYFRLWELLPFAQVMLTSVCVVLEPPQFVNIRSKSKFPFLLEVLYLRSDPTMVNLLFMFHLYHCYSGHCNVPATFRHSTLGSWVGKQREEYKKLKDKKSSQLDKYRIDKLNEIGFQWSLLNWTTVSWEDRFEAST
jgi:hypothetical protein